MLGAFQPTAIRRPRWSAATCSAGATRRDGRAYCVIRSSPATASSSSAAGLGAARPGARPPCRARRSAGLAAGRPAPLTVWCLLCSELGGGADGGEEHRPGPAPLRRVHRRPGVAARTRPPGRLRHDRRPSTRRCWLRRAATGLPSWSQRRVDAAGDAFRLRLVRDVRQQHDELVPAEPGDERGVWHGPAQSVCDRAQDDVTQLVPEGVVDVLEAVSVEQQQRDLPVGLSRRQGGAEGGVQAGAVRQAGQVVGPELTCAASCSAASCRRCSVSRRRQTATSSNVTPPRTGTRLTSLACS